MNKSVWVFGVVVALLLAGCNTVRGVGKDIEKGGEVIQKAVK